MTQKELENYSCSDISTRFSNLEISNLEIDVNKCLKKGTGSSASSFVSLVSDAGLTVLQNNKLPDISSSDNMLEILNNADV